MAVAVAAVALLAACQPAQDPLRDGAAEQTDGEPSDRMPTSLQELASRGSEEAGRWQEDPRLVEMRVELDGEDEPSWTTAQATFVAPDGHRLFVVEWGPQGRDEHRPRLAGLGLSPVPEEALAAVPALPDDIAEPSELAGAAQQALADCDFAGPATAVLYASGAPDAWDPAGGGWTQPPAWSATVTNADGAGVTLDPVTGERQQPECFAATP